jgi:hypothetical protein
MLFQKAVLEDLFNVVEETYQVPFWKGFCLMVDPLYLRAAGASEYEIYFNFVFARSDRVKIRHLNWTNAPSLDVLGKDGLNNYFQQGYDYVSCHRYD